MPSSLVDNYLAWWGLYHDAPWFNPSGAKQQKPVGGIELLYNTAEQPVWLVMMSSNAQTDRSSTGVVLFSTRENAGMLYPLTGIGVSDDVVKTISSNPSNIRNYGVGSLQLYQIYGEPTWVATFVRDSDIGQIFQGVGIVDARHLTGNNVIMAPTKTEALSQYAQWLAGTNTQGQGPTATAKKVDVEGKVERISSATTGWDDGLLYPARRPAAHLPGQPQPERETAPRAARRPGKDDIPRHWTERGDVDRVRRPQHPRERTCPITDAITGWRTWGLVVPAIEMLASRSIRL